MAKNNEFEKALNELKKYAEKIREKDITLDESIQCYEKGMASYIKCQEILENAKQKIEIFDEE